MATRRKRPKAPKKSRKKSAKRAAKKTVRRTAKKARKKVSRKSTAALIKRLMKGTVRKARKKAPKKAGKKTSKKVGKRRAGGPTVASLAKRKTGQLVSLHTKVQKALALKAKKVQGGFQGPRFNRTKARRAEQAKLQGLFASGVGGGI